MSAKKEGRAEFFLDSGGKTVAGKSFGKEWECLLNVMKAGIPEFKLE
jgi:hypothetical protein